MKRGFLRTVVLGFTLLAGLGLGLHARAEDETPDGLIKRLSAEVLDAIKADKSIRSGDLTKVIALVDAKILPNVDFQRMTASAVGPAWRQATPDQQKRLQQEFKVLLVRTYAGALAPVADQTIPHNPPPAAPAPTEGAVPTAATAPGAVAPRPRSTPPTGATHRTWQTRS